VMVGSATALADDPALTARRGGRVVHRPLRVLVDSRLAVPPAARLHRGGAGPSWVLCSARAPARRRRALLDAGVRLLEVPQRGEHVDLRRGLERLAREGLTEILVEGGGVLAAALLRAGLVDELHWFVAPRLLGDEGRPALAHLSVRRLAAAPALRALRVRRLGDDLWLTGRLGAAAVSR
jgi:diaminohydroxyphosphoribosylaminopyrimidine deaminase/5-amino-6-(5-phosphoribosylamino)uracil reductase